MNLVKTCRSWLTLFIGIFLLPFLCSGQFPYAPTTPEAQRSALAAVRAQITWLQTSTRTAPGSGEQGIGNVWRNFDAVRQTYADLIRTLNPAQRSAGANSLAELSAGLDILQEVFANYEQDRANGQSAGTAMRNMGRLLNQGSTLWIQELNKTCNRLQVGRR